MDNNNFNKVQCVGLGAHPIFGALSRRAVNPIKLAYDPRRSDDSRLIYQPAL